ncbi:hypothetical protein T11_15191 [Trichinella zimbabwensis]|uniref:Uncharacterized protein n=1 Tax=Trichinella zimbabwensis TaxID=268475 RepID=A0A0V1HRX7_9BILA|nr:hypothetical protein T11_15191 [Trichinella zimbabwensis]
MKDMPHRNLIVKLWLRTPDMRLLSILEIFFHLDNPAGQLLSFSKGQTTVLRLLQAATRVYRSPFDP